jgi:hypothetical protein
VGEEEEGEGGESEWKRMTIEKSMMEAFKVMLSSMCSFSFRSDFPP